MNYFKENTFNKYRKPKIVQKKINVLMFFNSYDISDSLLAGCLPCECSSNADCIPPSGSTCSNCCCSPQYYQKHNPSVRVTVVELDPGITEIAKNHFFLDKNHHLNIVHQDARIFLNENTEKFDSVIIDVFKGSSEIPFQIATIEAVDKIYKALNPEGTVIINFVSAIQDNNGKIARALYSTYREKFPQVYLFPLNRINYQNIGNVELVALKSSKLASFSSNNPIYQKFLDNLYSKDIITDVPVLTDDFAPLEHYMMAAVN